MSYGPYTLANDGDAYSTGDVLEAGQYCTVSSDWPSPGTYEVRNDPQFNSTVHPALSVDYANYGNVVGVECPVTDNGAGLRYVDLYWGYDDINAPTSTVTLTPTPTAVSEKVTFRLQYPKSSHTSAPPGS